MSLSGASAKVFLVIFFTERQFEELLISFIDALKLKLKYDKNEFKIVDTFFNFTLQLILLRSLENSIIYNKLRIM